MASIAENILQVRGRIEAACRAFDRLPTSVTLLAVSKTCPGVSVREAFAAGERDFGENYVQEALAKIDALADLRGSVSWHLIGPLQSNKTRPVAERFDWVHSVESDKVARRLSEQRPAGLAPLNALIQVNVSGEGTKSGVALKHVFALADSIHKLPRLKLRGLMAVPEPGAGIDRYRALKAMYEKLKGDFAFDTLSVGMSEDLEVAIAEGSTLVRVGTAIFGARQKIRPAA